MAAARLLVQYRRQLVLPCAACVRSISGAGAGRRPHHKANRAAGVDGADGTSPAAFNPSGVGHQTVCLDNITGRPQFAAPGIEVATAWLEAGERRRLASREACWRMLRKRC